MLEKGQTAALRGPLHPQEKIRGKSELLIDKLRPSWVKSEA